jgi:cytochrome c
MSMKSKTGVLVAAAISLVGAITVAAEAPLNGDSVHGKMLYQGCQACHTVEENDLGPRHRGVVGRRAGSIDRWLTNPSALVPGTKMFFKLDSPQDRADVIAYLKELR